MALWYLIGVPVLGALYAVVYLRLLEAAIGIGDSDNPVLSLPHGVAMTVLSFPMRTLCNPLCGDVLKKRLGDNGTIYVFVGINAVIWGAMGTCASSAWEWSL